MKYAVCNEMFKSWPQEKVADFVARTGYAGIEIAPFTISAVPELPSSGERERLRGLFESAGLRVVGLHWLLAGVDGVSITTADDGCRKRTIRYLSDLIGLCRDLGGEIMVFGSPKQRVLAPGQDAGDAFRNAVSVFGSVMPAASSAGVTVCFEPLTPAETDFINTMRQGSRLVEAVSHPNFRLHLDVKAMCGAEGRPPADTIREEGGRLLRHFHANDPSLLGPGMGEVDQVPIGRALRDIAYDRWVSVETFTEGPGPEEVCRRSMETLRRAYA